MRQVTSSTNLYKFQKKKRLASWASVFLAHFSTVMAECPLVLGELVCTSDHTRHLVTVHELLLYISSAMRWHLFSHFVLHYNQGGKWICCVAPLLIGCNISENRSLPLEFCSQYLLLSDMRAWLIHPWDIAPDQACSKSKGLQHQSWICKDSTQS